MRGFQTYRKYSVVEIQFGFICFTLHVHDGCQMWSYPYINKKMGCDKFNVFESIKREINIYKFNTIFLKG